MFGFGFSSQPQPQPQPSAINGGRPDFDAGLNTSSAWTRTVSLDPEREPGSETHNASVGTIKSSSRTRQRDASATRNPSSSSSHAPELELPSTFSETSTLSSPTISFLTPQHTSDWIAGHWSTIRKSVLGGKSLNRFGSFVSSGAEDWILYGSPAPNGAVDGLPVDESNGFKGRVYDRRTRTGMCAICFVLSSPKT